MLGFTHIFGLSHQDLGFKFSEVKYQFLFSSKVIR